MNSNIIRNYFSTIVYTFVLLWFLMINAWNIDDSGVDNTKWQKLNDHYIRDIIEYKGEIIYCSNQGVFNLHGQLHTRAAYCLATDGDILVAGTSDGLLILDSTWRRERIFQGDYSTQIRSIKNYNKIFYLGHTEGSYGVTTWHPSEGILSQDDFHAHVRTIELNGTNVLAGDEDGNIWVSTNMGRSFDSTIHLDNKHLTVRKIKLINDRLFIGAGWLFIDFIKTEHYLTPTDFESKFIATGEKGVYKVSENNDLITFNTGLNELRTSCLLLINDELYCGTVSGLYKRKIN